MKQCQFKGRRNSNSIFKKQRFLNQLDHYGYSVDEAGFGAFLRHYNCIRPAAEMSLMLKISCRTIGKWKRKFNIPNIRSRGGNNNPTGINGATIGRYGG